MCGLLVPGVKTPGYFHRSLWDGEPKRRISMQRESPNPPCVLHEDEHLLVVNKPAGLNTHAPGPFAGEGVYDWLRHREPRWARLAIVHRLDKETSGVLVFGKTTAANRSLTEQFTQRGVQKKYLLLTDRSPKRPEFAAKSKIARAGERYISGTHGEPAETRFRLLNSKFKIQNLKLVEAEPLTGRTHQVRVHAAEHGFPVLGDTLYGGSPFHRVCLHSAELTFEHPGTGKLSTFRAPVDFAADSRLALRESLIDPQDTNALRLVHGASDGWPGWYVDRVGDYLLSQSERELTPEQRQHLETFAGVTGVYHKLLSRRISSGAEAAVSPRLKFGAAAPDRFAIRENGVQFELSFNEGYSTGLFLDQRDNRRRLLSNHVAADFPLRPSAILNCFAYTCAFSVCAAKAGARTTSLDLSRKYLEWGRRNFALNGLDPGEHDFIFGDVFDWLRRLAGKKRAFDMILLDPPTFSQSKARGAFRADKDYGRLIKAALPLLKSGGVLFASANAAGWAPEKFLAGMEAAISAAGRKIVQSHYVPQPPDFPVSRTEPAYLKTIWLRL
jgi:23S rRNA (cytosine1962-C5)-methyltransferase